MALDWSKGVSDMENTPKGDEAAPRKKKYGLADMVARMNPDNLHPEIDWGQAQGREEW